MTIHPRDEEEVVALPIIGASFALAIFLLGLAAFLATIKPEKTQIEAFRECFIYAAENGMTEPAKYCKYKLSTDKE